MNSMHLDGRVRDQSKSSWYHGKFRADTLFSIVCLGTCLSQRVRFGLRECDRHRTFAMEMVTGSETKGI